MLGLFYLPWGMYIGEVTVTKVRAVLLTMGNVDRGGNSN